MITALGSMFLLGLTGSLHCAGMCGPIVLALGRSGGRMQTMLLYHAGRAFTYGMMGLLIGFVGQQIDLLPYQRTSSIVIGIILIIAVLVQLTPMRKFLHYAPPVFKRVSQKWFKKALQNRRSMFVVGMANGALPCGLVYLALMSALATENAVIGAFGMLLFGVGTAPILMLVQSADKVEKIRPFLRKAFPVLMLAASVLLVLRGLGLGIPFISPDMAGGGCCHP